MELSELHEIWRKYQGKSEDDKKPTCPIAAEFLKKIEETLFQPLQRDATRAKVAQAKYLLQEEYHMWRKSVPARHLRDTSGHHRCVTDVYDAAYDQLHLLDLSIRPPMNLILEHDVRQTAVTVPQPPPPPPQIAGIFMGEDD